MLERTRRSGSQAILPGLPAERSLCKNLLREEYEDRSLLPLAKFRGDWTWECRPVQKSILAHFPFSELGAQQDPSPGQQQSAPAGRRDNARGSGSPLGMQRSEQSHWGQNFPQLLCHIPHSGRLGPHLCTSASHRGQPCQCHKWSLKTKTSWGVTVDYICILVSNSSWSSGPTTFAASASTAAECCYINSMSLPDLRHPEYSVVIPFPYISTVSIHKLHHKKGALYDC